MKIKTDSNDRLDQIKNDVAFELGHINYAYISKMAYDGNIGYVDFEEYVNAVARAYAKDVESYYIETED